MDYQQRFHSPSLPFKSVAIALLYTVLLGPVGLLYASLRGGIFMIVLGFVVICSKFIIPIILFWISCSIWSVAATNHFNKNLLAD